MTRLRSGLVLAACAALLACGELSDLWQLRSELAERYGDVSVHLSVENSERELQVGLEDEKLLRLPPQEQVTLAIDVGRFVDSRYARSARVDVYDVRFVARRRSLLFFESERYESFRMTPAELR